MFSHDSWLFGQCPLPRVAVWLEIWCSLGALVPQNQTPVSLAMLCIHSISHTFKLFTISPPSPYILIKDRPTQSSGFILLKLLQFLLLEKNLRTGHGTGNHPAPTLPSGRLVLNLRCSCLSRHSALITATTLQTPAFFLSVFYFWIIVRFYFSLPPFFFFGTWSHIAQASFNSLWSQGWVMMLCLPWDGFTSMHHHAWGCACASGNFTLVSFLESLPTPFGDMRELRSTSSIVACCCC